MSTAAGGAGVGGPFRLRHLRRQPKRTLPGQAARRLQRRQVLLPQGWEGVVGIPTTASDKASWWWMRGLRRVCGERAFGWKGRLPGGPSARGRVLGPRRRFSRRSGREPGRCKGLFAVLRRGVVRGAWRRRPAFRWGGHHRMAAWREGLFGGITVSLRGGASSCPLSDARDLGLRHSRARRHAGWAVRRPFFEDFFGLLAYWRNVGVKNTGRGRWPGGGEKCCARDCLQRGVRGQRVGGRGGAATRRGEGTLRLETCRVRDFRDWGGALWGPVDGSPRCGAVEVSGLSRRPVGLSKQRHRRGGRRNSGESPGRAKEGRPRGR